MPLQPEVTCVLVCAISYDIRQNKRFSGSPGTANSLLWKNPFDIDITFSMITKTEKYIFRNMGNHIPPRMTKFVLFSIGGMILSKCHSITDDIKYTLDGHTLRSNLMDSSTKHY